MLHFPFLSPCDTHRVKIQVDQGLRQVSRSCSSDVQPLEMCFRHYVPWTKIPDDMKRFIINLKMFLKKSFNPFCWVRFYLDGKDILRHARKLESKETASPAVLEQNSHKLSSCCGKTRYVFQILRMQKDA